MHDGFVFNKELVQWRNNSLGVESGMERHVQESNDAKGAGDQPADTPALFPLVYTRLRELAAQYLQRQKPAQTMEPTALVHEAYVHLADRAGWKNKAHLLGVAARAMREILVDHARRRMAAKRGGGRRRLTMSSQILEMKVPVDVLTVHELLERLAALNQRQAKVVELRFFGGMTIREVAQSLDVSESTVEEDWRFARAWLSARLSEGTSP